MRATQEPTADLRWSLRVGERALHTDGDLRAARLWFDAAYGDAERQGDDCGMARAALGLSGLWASEHRTAADAAMVRVRQRDVLPRLDPQSQLALRLRIRLVGEQDYRTGKHTTSLAMVARARRTGDSVALAEALSLAHHCMLGPEHEKSRPRLAQELIGEASRTGRRSDLLMGLLWHTVDLLLSADPRAERHLEELRGLLARQEHVAVGYVVGAIEVMQSIRAGRLGPAEALAAACAERGALAGDLHATGWYGAQLATIRWYQGRIGELVPMLADLVSSPTLSAIDYSSLGGLAVAAATTGDMRLAAQALARLRGRGLAELPPSSSWLMSMYGVTEAAHLLGDAEISAQVYALLSPFAHLPVMTSLGVTCLGSAHHPLGVASITVGDVDSAVTHLHAAVRDNLALGHWPATVLSRWRLGQALAVRDGSHDATAWRERALAAQDAATLGMTLPDGKVQRPSLVMSRRGRRWQIDLGGRSTHVDHSVGMSHLAALLANPGHEIPAIDLMAGLGTAIAAASRSAQSVLDDHSRREYRQRLARLQAELDELESTDDHDRAETIRTERDWLIAELASATGLAGRPRHFADEEERARVAVGKAIRRAVDRITKADPVIGNLLRTTVQTGIRCSYRPE